MCISLGNLINLLFFNCHLIDLCRTQVKYDPMPEALDAYRKIEVGIGSTPLESYVFASNIFYKHTNPLGL